MITPKHTRTPREHVADPAHLGMDRKFFDIERFLRLAEIKMNRIITTVLFRPLFERGQYVRDALETGHEHRPADALQP